MTCNKTLWDIKRIGYDTQVYTNYTSPIGITFKEILTQKDGLTLDTKNELGEFTTLNGVRYTDSERIGLRNIGTLKFTRNFDTNLFDNHLDLIEAGLGELVTSANLVTVTAGKGVVGTPFLTTSTVNISVGSIVYIPTIGYRTVTSLVTNASFIIDNPLDETISTSTVFTNGNKLDLTNPIGNCKNTFNFVVQLADGSYIKMMGCGIKCEFELVYEKQLVITFNIMSPDVTELTEAPTGWSSITAETKANPVICSFTSSNVITSGVAQSYFPPLFTLGLSITEEPMKAIGGLNNMLGYLNRSSIKSKISFDRITTCKTWVLSPRTSRKYVFAQSNLALEIESGYLTLIDRSVANGNHDTISCEMDNNIDAASRVYLYIP